ncbi:MAG: hypothetical protein U1E74_03780 [Paenacidovorax caeni]
MHAQIGLDRLEPRLRRPRTGVPRPGCSAQRQGAEIQQLIAEAQALGIAIAGAGRPCQLQRLLDRRHQGKVSESGWRRARYVGVDAALAREGDEQAL